MRLDSNLRYCAGDPGVVDNDESDDNDIGGW